NTTQTTQPTTSDPKKHRRATETQAITPTPQSTPAATSQPKKHTTRGKAVEAQATGSNTTQTTHSARMVVDTDATTSSNPAPSLAERLIHLRHALAQQNHEIQKTNEVINRSNPPRNLTGPGEPGDYWDPPTSIVPELRYRSLNKLRATANKASQPAGSAHAPVLLSHVEITAPPPKRRRSPAPSRLKPSSPAEAAKASSPVQPSSPVYPSSPVQPSSPVHPSSSPGTNTVLSPRPNSAQSPKRPNRNIQPLRLAIPEPQRAYPNETNDVFSSGSTPGDVEMSDAEQQSSPLVTEWENEQEEIGLQEYTPEFDEETQYDFRSYHTTSPRLIQGYLEPDTNEEHARMGALYEVQDPVTGGWCTLPDGFHPSLPPPLPKSHTELNINLDDKYVFQRTVRGQRVAFIGHLNLGDHEEYDRTTLMSDFNRETWYPIPEGYQAPLLLIRDTSTSGSPTRQQRPHHTPDSDDGSGACMAEEDIAEGEVNGESIEDEEDEDVAEREVKDLSSASGSSYGEVVEAERRQREFDHRHGGTCTVTVEEEDIEMDNEYEAETQPTPDRSSKSKGKRPAVETEKDDEALSDPDSEEDLPAYLLYGSDAFSHQGEDDEEMGRGSADHKDDEPARYKTGPYSKQEDQVIQKIRGTLNEDVDDFVKTFRRPRGQVLNKVVPQIKLARKSGALGTYKQWFSLRYGNTETKGLGLPEWTAHVMKRYNDDYLSLDEEGQAAFLATMKAELACKTLGQDQSDKARRSGIRLCEVQHTSLAEAYWDRRQIIVVGVIMSLDSDPVLPQLQTVYAGEPRVRKLLTENDVPVRRFIDLFRSSLKTALDGGETVLPLIAGPSQQAMTTKRSKQPRQAKEDKDVSDRDRARLTIPALMVELFCVGGISVTQFPWAKCLTVLVDKERRVILWYEDYPNLGRGLNIDSMNSQQTVRLARLLSSEKDHPRVAHWTPAEKKYSANSTEYLDIPLVITKSGAVLSRIRDIERPGRVTKRKASGPAAGDEEAPTVTQVPAPTAGLSKATSVPHATSSRLHAASRPVRPLPPRVQEVDNEHIREHPRKRRREDADDEMAFDDVAPRFNEGYTVVGGPFMEPDVRVRGRMVQPQHAGGGRGVSAYRAPYFREDRHGPTLYRRIEQDYERVPSHGYYDGMGIADEEYGPRYAGVNAYPVGGFSRVREGPYGGMVRREF
ncbi:hypothetical protein Hypma_009679, partial [Hypsizygus marmoreus]